MALRLGLKLGLKEGLRFKLVTWLELTRQREEGSKTMKLPSQRIVIGETAEEVGDLARAIL